jgi:predicted double-glycine peptidase
LINELETLVEDGHYPIAFLNLAPIDGFDEQHAVVVIEMNDRAVMVFDPLYGERMLPRDIFQAAWGSR